MFREHPGRVELVAWDDGDVPSGRPDVVLVETSPWPGAAPVRLDRLVAAAGPARVVPFVWHIDPDEIAEAIAAGAAGYLWKGLGADELLGALDDLCFGAPLPRPDTSERYRQIMAENRLSKREFEVLSLIARGATNREIAEGAYLSINSVKTYIRSAYRKIGVTRRAQAAAWALRQGFDPTPLHPRTTP
jgi:NarL family two-component system response regulator LiaR